MRGGQRHRDVATADVADNRGLLRFDRIHHGERVIHPRLEDGHLDSRNRVRKPGSPFVEHQQPAERRQPLPEGRQRPDVPLRLHVADPNVQGQDVRRPVPQNLVRDVKPPEPRVPRLRDHAASVPASFRFGSDEWRSASMGFVPYAPRGAPNLSSAGRDLSGCKRPKLKEKARCVMLTTDS